MFIEISLVILLGIISGIFTGLIPGIHINLVCALVISNLAIISIYFSDIFIIIFIISMGVTHSFIDFIPSVLFGVPDSDTALSVLPAHRLVNDGKAYLAIFLSSLGSLMGMIFAFLVMFFFFFFLDRFYDKIKFLIPYFLTLIILTLIFFEKGLNKKFWAIIIVIFSGGLGMLILNSPLFSDPLLCLFSGLFGISALYMSLKEDSVLPKQDLVLNFKFTFEYVKALFIGGIASVFASISPGIGNAQAATLSSLFFKNITTKSFIFVLSSINTINFILSFITYYIIEKARNGSVIAISKVSEQITLEEIQIYLIVIFIVGIISFFITIYLGKFIIKMVLTFDIKKINLTIIFFLFLIVFLLTDIFGFLLLWASIFLGLLCINLKVGRVHLMSTLIIPVIFFLI